MWYRPRHDPGAGLACRVRLMGAEWEQRSAASCGQAPSDTVIVAAAIASDVLERHQAAALFACVLSSGRRGRRFKSGHPDHGHPTTGHRPRAIIAGELGRLPAPGHPVARFQARALRLAGGIHERLAVFGEWTLEPASSVP